MEYKMIVTGTRVEDSRTGIEFEIVQVGESKAKLVEILPEDSEDTPRELEMTADNVATFKFRGRTEGFVPEVPNAEIKNGVLVVGSEAAQLGALIPNAILGTIPGVVVFSVVENEKTNVYSYNTLAFENKVAKIMDDVADDIKLMSFDHNINVFVENKFAIVPVLDENGKEVIEDGVPKTEKKLVRATVSQFKGEALTMPSAGAGCCEYPCDDCDCRCECGGDDYDCDTYTSYVDGDNDCYYSAEVINLSRPVASVAIVEYGRKYKTLVVTSTDEDVKDGIVVPGEDKVIQLYQINVSNPVRDYWTINPNPVFVGAFSGKLKSVTPTKPNSRLAFIIESDDNWIFTNSGFQPIYVSNKAVIKELKGFDSVAKTWANRDKNVTVLTLSNAKRELISLAVYDKPVIGSYAEVHDANWRA